MPKFDSQTSQFLAYALLAIIGIVLFVVGYAVGRMLLGGRHRREIQSTRNDLFTTQQGFKKLYETEIATLRQQNDSLTAQAKALEVRVEEYRKKAAGFGGLFSSGNKKS